MKNRLLAAVSFAAFVSCSAPKYTYFDYSAGNVNSGKTYEMKSEKRKDKNDTDGTIYSEAPVANSSKRIVLSNGPSSKANPRMGWRPTPTTSRWPAPTTSRRSPLTTAKKGDANALQEIRTIKNAPTEPVKDGRKYRNAFAIAGFILAFVPIIIFVEGILTPLAFEIYMISLVSVFVLSALGITSKKRGFAIAGLILGTIEAVLIAVWIFALEQGSK